MAGRKMWFAFTLFARDGQAVDRPAGYVREVVVVNDDDPTGEKIVRYVEHGHLTTVGGPHCSGRLFSTEAEGWAFCAEQLREQAARFDRAAAECAAKAAVEVAA